MTRSNEELIKLYNQLREDLINCPCGSACEVCVSIEGALGDVVSELKKRGLRIKSPILEESSSLSNEDIGEAFVKVLNKAFGLAIRELDGFCGTCPFDRYDVNIDCDSCNNDTKKCWKKYFISLAQKHYNKE